jgi:hypothetical protein
MQRLRLMSAIMQLAFIAGCGGGVAPLAAGESRAASWMLPEANSDDLLYVSDEAANTVRVLSYPRLRHVGTLTGFRTPFGECADKAGNVWIVNRTPAEVIEYAHGGTSPIAILSVPGSLPFGCAVDPLTGNLAVTNGNNEVSIYQGAQGSPATYTDSAFTRLKFCAYDNQGNLFFVGAGYDRVAEMPYGSATFTTVSFNEGLRGILSIQWDGTYMAIGGDQNNNEERAIKVYRVQIVGGYGTVEGTTYLSGHGDHVAYAQFWIQGDTIVQPFGNHNKHMGLWQYPAGGNPVSALRHTGHPFGVAVSVAPSRSRLVNARYRL